MLHAWCPTPGRPGVGKTTAIREVSRTLGDDLAKRVVIVDTSNEIGGDGDIPHPGIGRARRMQVPNPEEQHRVMIEAVENHMPEVSRARLGAAVECTETEYGRLPARLQVPLAEHADVKSAPAPAGGGHR